MSPANPYEYAGDNPSGNIDPAGLWALRCRDIVLEGLPWLVGGFNKQRFRHCWVECDGASYSLSNPNWVATPIINDPVNHLHGTIVGSGADKCDCIKCRYFMDQNNQTYPYSPLDCNSNWYANNLLKSCGIKAPMPDRAVGWDTCNRWVPPFHPIDYPDVNRCCPIV